MKKKWRFFFSFSCTSHDLIVPLALPNVLRHGYARKKKLVFFLHIS